MRRQLVHVINAALALGLVGGSLAAWPGLPERLPIHFGPDGQADRWADTTFLSWYGLPALAILLAAGLYLLAAVVPAKPHWINLRDKQRFLSLPEGAREPVYRRVQSITHLSTAFLLVIMSLVQLAVYTEAHGSSAQTLVRAVLGVAAGGSLVISTIAIVGMQRAIDESMRRGARMESTRPA